MKAVQGDDICALPATRMRQLITDRQLSSHEVVEAHISRIERIDDVVNSVVTRVFDDALETAKKIYSEEVGDRVLFGLPIAHKDLVPTAGIRTTYGSSLFAEHVPKEDHPLVRRLKRAGAVTIGKTNVPEFGAGSHTFNPVFGATRNPYHTGRTCGGSSGGSGGSPSDSHVADCRRQRHRRLAAKSWSILQCGWFQTYARSSRSADDAEPIMELDQYVRPDGADG